MSDVVAKLAVIKLRENKLGIPRLTADRLPIDNENCL